MNRKRNVAFSKPEDPEFLKRIKKQVGYDDRNHKFDELKNNEQDFASDEDDEQPQVVVLEKGDLTAEEAEEQKRNKEKLELETKADLNQRIFFKPNPNKDGNTKVNHSKKIINKDVNKKLTQNKKDSNLLSFDDNDDCDSE